MNAPPATDLLLLQFFLDPLTFLECMFLKSRVDVWLQQAFSPRAIAVTLLCCPDPPPAQSLTAPAVGVLPAGGAQGRHSVGPVRSRKVSSLQVTPHNPPAHSLHLKVCLPENAIYNSHIKINNNIALFSQGPFVFLLHQPFLPRWWQWGSDLTTSSA